MASSSPCRLAPFLHVYSPTSNPRDVTEHIKVKSHIRKQKTARGIVLSNRIYFQTVPRWPFSWLTDPET